jgi:hypothetical protein
VLILAGLGFLAGVVVRPHLGATPVAGAAQSQAARGGESGIAAVPSARPTSSPSASLAPLPQSSGRLELAVQEAQSRTGLQYTEPGCASGQPCLSAAKEVDGQGAAYVQMAAQGYAAGRQCYVYMYAQASTWKVSSMACGSAPGFAPAIDTMVTVHASGSCGRLRTTAGLRGAVARCLANGSIAAVTGPPQLADAQLWWPVSASGSVGMLSQDLLLSPAAMVPAR